MLRAAPLPALLALMVASDASELRWVRTAEWLGNDSAATLVVREPWQGAREPLGYTFIPPTAPRRGAPPTAVRLPVRRVAALASVHVAMLSELGEAERIIAVDARSHVYDASVRAAVAEGRVLPAGSGPQLNVERLLTMRPDLVLANAVGASEHAALQRLARAGVPVVITSEWMENHPLARAEWLRVIGRLVGRAERADSIFAFVESAYLEQAEIARAREEKPFVMLGAPFRDQWFVPGGRSYMARFLEDAGAYYLWRDDLSAGGIPLSIETVLARAAGAQLWLNPGDWRSLGDGVSRDSRFSAFSAFRRGDVYNNDARLHSDGANDFWESGAVRPDRVLADLISIFHGTEDALYYYRRLPP